jgi:uncharacterized lipoprotein YddW (UPF0748 family)
MKIKFTPVALTLLMGWVCSMCCLSLYGQTCLTAGPEISSTHPKHELRGAWISTVANLDWPSSRTATPATQQAELRTLLDTMESAGINVLFLQVRPESDAFYASTIDPWSYYLTGTQGRAPSPFWDPLSFAITEAHNRGMELHAWINPYRVKQGTPTLASNNVGVLHPSWTFVAGTTTQLDPGLPQVRTYLVSVIDDIASRYDIDGIHFDDYFYPYSGMSNQDASTYANNNPNGLSLANWRRDNVNKLVAMVYDKIQIINGTKKSNIRFGISPFGIWKSGVPAGITGMSAYDAIYCDALAWLQAGKVDYIAPQLYWGFGGGQDYAALSAWWDDKAALYGRHCYPGLALYKMTDANNWPASVIQNQIIENRKSFNSSTEGQIFFRAGYLKNNDKNIKTLLQANEYKYEAFPPPMPWRDVVCPNTPANVNYSAGMLSWNTPVAASDGDLPVKYVVYRFNTTAEISTNAQDGTKVIDILRGTNISIPSSLLTAANNYFVVSSLDDNNNESVFSNSVNVQKPVAPITVNDAASTPQGQSIAISVLANDTDENGNINPATVVISTAAANGTTSVSTTGVVTYTPNTGFAGNDSFTYTVKDSSNLVSNIATVSITVGSIITAVFQIDINHTNSITKPGWTGLVGTEGNYITISGTKFTMFGGIEGTRDRGTAGEVTRDFAFHDVPSAGIGFRMENIPAGTYDVNTWHYDPAYPGLVNVEFREKGNTATTQVKVTNHSLTNSASTTFQIVVEAGKDYEIITRENSAEDRARFNGIKLTQVSSGQKTMVSSANNTVAPKSIQANTVKAYPNPVANELQLEITSKKAGKAIIKIYNVAGQQFAEKTFEMQEGKNITSLKVSNWASNFYIISMNMPDGETIQTKIIKQ